MEQFYGFKLRQLQVLHTFLVLLRDTIDVVWADIEVSNRVELVKLKIDADDYEIQLTRDNRRFEVIIQAEWNCEVFVDCVESKAELVEFFRTIQTTIEHAIEPKSEESSTSYKQALSDI